MSPQLDRKEFISLAGAAAVGMAMGRPARAASPKNWVWVRGDFSSMESWKPQFAKWRATGLHAILPNTGDAETLRRIIPAARAEGLETHAWIFTMMRGGMEAEHPEWYAVNRNGDSTATDPPYVNYYRFLCPSRAPVRQHITAHVAALSRIEGLSSVHLDYVRFPDVILPRSLWEQYGLVQDREHPEFDYCYCDECRRQFGELTGQDPLALEDPPADERWLQFRYDQITRVVGQAAAAAHGGGKELTAAVFPTPDIARSLVRQEWPIWQLDAVLPMLYHSFYLEPVAWIEEGARQGVEALAGRIPLYAGLYVPELTADELAEATDAAFAGGASGISLFESQSPTDRHWAALAEALADRS